MMITIARIARRCGINLNYVFAPRIVYRRREPLRLPRQGDMTRRAILAALPATGAAMALPGRVMAGQKDEFAAAYSAWSRVRESYNSWPGDLEDEGAEALFQELCRIEDKMAEMPPSTIRDYAFKILVADDCGDMSTNVHQVALVEEARQIIAGA